MKQSKTTYLILLLIFLVIVIVAVQVLKTPTEQKGAEQGETGQTEKGQQVDVTSPFKIRFGNPVTLESIIYEIHPEEQVTISLDSTGTEVTFEHIQAWNFDTLYTIKILKSTVSSDFVPLDKDYEFTFKTVPYSGI